MVHEEPRAGGYAEQRFRRGLRSWRRKNRRLFAVRLGFEGERRTAKELRRLERAGLHVAHDVQDGHGNYDHIAVGAAGVYLLESKNLDGIVEIREGVPYLTRRHDPEDERAWGSIPQRARRDAARLRGEIQARTGHRTWVQAVVVLWSEFPAGVVEEDRCVFVHGSWLREWLQDRPSWLSQAEAEEVAAGIAGIARDAGAAKDVVPPAQLHPA
jgi:hypothetical protein